MSLVLQIAARSLPLPGASAARDNRTRPPRHCVGGPRADRALDRHSRSTLLQPGVEGRVRGVSRSRRL